MTRAPRDDAEAPAAGATAGTRRSVLVASLTTFTAPAALILALLTVTWFVASSVASSASGWAGIGYAYIGAGVAVLVGAVAIPVAARVSFARALPAGARVRPALACALATAAVSTVDLPGGVPLVPLVVALAHLASLTPWARDGRLFLAAGPTAEMEDAHVA